MNLERRSLLLALMAMAAVSACGCSGDAQGHDGAAGTNGGATCDHDGCIVPLSEAAGVCPPDYGTAMSTTTCPQVTLRSGACAGRWHLEILTGFGRHDCYYAGGSQDLVGAVIRSDASFTKVAGTVPTAACPATDTVICDHSATGAGGAGGSGGGSGGAGRRFEDETCEFVPGFGSSGGDAAAPTDGGGAACPATHPGYAPKTSCASWQLACDYPQGRCTCTPCKYYGGELYLSYWVCVP